MFRYFYGEKAKGTGIKNGWKYLYRTNKISKDNKNRSFFSFLLSFRVGISDQGWNSCGNEFLLIFLIYVCDLLQIFFSSVEIIWICQHWQIFAHSFVEGMILKSFDFTPNDVVRMISISPSTHFFDRKQDVRLPKFRIITKVR